MAKVKGRICDEAVIDEIVTGDCDDNDGNDVIVHPSASAAIPSSMSMTKVCDEKFKCSNHFTGLN